LHWNPIADADDVPANCCRTNFIAVGNDYWASTALEKQKELASD